MYLNDEIKVLKDIPVTSKDGKVLVPALVTLFQEFQEKLGTMFQDKLGDMMTELREEFSKVCHEKDAQISNLQSEVDILHKKVEKLEDRVDDGDSYEGRDTLIVSGSRIPPSNNQESCPDIVCKLARDILQVVISPNDVSVSHRLSSRNPSKQGEDRSDIIVKFCRRNTKLDLLNACRKMKPENFYVNEFLTPPRQTIAYILRKAKREFPTLISGSTSFDGSVYVYVKPPNPDAPLARDSRMKINTHSRLTDFCRRTLNKPITHFIREWSH